MLLFMVREVDLDRVEVPEGYEVLDATALAGRLGIKRETVLSISKMTLNLHGPQQAQGVQNSLPQFLHRVIEAAGHEKALEPAPHSLYEVQVRAVGGQVA
jgi:hypothetical protein